VREDVGACVSLMSGSGFKRAAFSGGGAAARTASLEGWRRQEEDEGVLDDTADDIVWAENPASKEEESEGEESDSCSASGQE